MTVEQALARARELRPGCKISDETCRRWLCEEDALLRQQLFEKSGADEYAAAGADLAWSGEALPDDTVLLVPVPFDALYPHVLCARIDAALGETDRYAGEQAQCNGLLSELAVWLRQKHPPRCRAEVDAMSGTSRAAAATSRTLLRAFGGLNETYSCTEAEAGSSKNFSSRDFPALSTRIPRRRLRSVVQMNGIYHLNGLLVAAGKNLIYNSDETPQEAEFFWNAVADSKKKMVGMGTKVIIFPDKIAFDTRDRSVTKLGAVWDSGGADVVLTPCDASGKTYTVSGKGTKEPENPADGQLFLKVNNIQKPYSSESVLEVYNEASGNWSAIELKWCRIEAGGIGKNFAVWDTVTVSGVEDGDDLHWKELKGDRIVTARGDDWVQVQAEPGGDYFYGTLTKGREMLRWTGIDGKGATMEGNTDAFRLERRVPDLDYLTECDNRLWGCAQNENVIYGCKLGDPTNWFSYRGIAEDSYAVTVGSDGPFTGAATCLGSVLFFKENALHKLYGSKPSDFQLSSLRCRGVARNAASSLCVLNETLYYLSPDGVMAWDGSIPTKVSEKLNTARLSNVQTAVGGALDGRYYLYLARDSGREGDALEERLLVYDTERGLWQEEDGCSYAMASTGGQLYLWDGHDIWAADPSRERDWKTTEGVEETVDFELITGAFGMDEAEDRYLSRLTLQMDAVCASNVELAICYDDGPWEKLAQWAVAGKQKRFDLHLAPRRCGMFRLRLTGKGQITLRSLARTLATARGRLMEQEA